MKEEEKRGGAMNIPVRRYTRLRRGAERKGVQNKSRRDCSAAACVNSRDLRRDLWVGGLLKI